MPNTRAEKTARQRKWADYAARESERGNGVLAGLFALLSLPNEEEAAKDKETQDNA